MLTFSQYGKLLSPWSLLLFSLNKFSSLSLLQPPHHFKSLFLDCFSLSTSYKGIPKTGISHSRCELTEEDNHFPWFCSCAAVNTAQEAVDFLWCQVIWLAHVQLSVITPRCFQQSCYPAGQCLYYCKGSFLLIPRTLNLSLSSFMRLLYAFSSQLLEWQTGLPLHGCCPGLTSSENLMMLHANLSSRSFIKTLNNRVPSLLPLSNSRIRMS